MPWLVTWSGNSKGFLSEKRPVVRGKNPWRESRAAATVPAPDECNRDTLPSNHDRTFARPAGICVYSGMVTIGNSVKPVGDIRQSVSMCSNMLKFILL